jgi:hypothetical protein
VLSPGQWGIVVSESSLERLFCHGQLVGEIIPEVWMVDHAHFEGVAKREQVGELTIVTPSWHQTPIASERDSFSGQRA